MTVDGDGAGASALVPPGISEAGQERVGHIIDDAAGAVTICTLPIAQGARVERRKTGLVFNPAATLKHRSWASNGPTAPP